MSVVCQKAMVIIASFLREKIRFPELKGFNRRGLYRMKQFYETYSSSAFISPLVTQLQKAEDEIIAFITTLLVQIGWSQHLLILSKTKTPEERLFYIHQSINEKLSKRELERQLNSSTFERTFLANTKVSPALSHLPQNLFKDPHIFEFLNLPAIHSEKDLETAVTLNLQTFILEIGKGFAYMGNQYRLQVGNKDYHTDLLFYNRDLQCMVLFELKYRSLSRSSWASSTSTWKRLTGM